MNDYNRGALPDPCLRLDFGFGEQWASVELGDGTGYVQLFDYEKLKAENAKLRELVADAIPLIWLGNVDCSGCLHMRECYAGEATDFAPENCRLVVRARELGIEADS